MYSVSGKSTTVGLILLNILPSFLLTGKSFHLISLVKNSLNNNMLFKIFHVKTFSFFVFLFISNFILLFQKFFSEQMENNIETKIVSSVENCSSNSTNSNEPTKENFVKIGDDQLESKESATDIKVNIFMHSFICSTVRSQTFWKMK